MWKSPREPVDSLLTPLAATTGLLGVLLLWARTYEQSCVVLVSPGLVYLAVFWGLLEYRLERRRFAIEYYLDSSSSWRRWSRRWWLPAAISLVVAFPLAVILSVFAALARAADWQFLAGASLVAPMLFSRLAVWPGRHFRRAAGGGILDGPAGILTSRLAGRLLLAFVVIAYVYFNYSVIPAPPNIFPGEPLLTGHTFAEEVRSACPVVETGLRAAAWFDGAAWSVVTDTAITERMPEGIMVIAWGALFLNAALAMTGFVCGLEGGMLLTRRVAAGTRAIGATDSGVATDSQRWTAGRRRGALLLIPLTVLAATEYHAIQQRAEELWSAEIRVANWPEIRQTIDKSVETAFAPAYAVIPEIVDRYYSVSGLLDPLTALVGENKTIVAELRRTVTSARKTAVDQVYRDLHEARVSQLGRLFSQEVAALPQWLRGAYAWLLNPVHARARRTLEHAVHEGPTDILSEIERAAATADYATRMSGAVRQLGGTVLEIFGLNREKEALRQALIAVMHAEKDLTKDRLLRKVEAVMFTPRDDFVPSELPSASH